MAEMTLDEFNSEMAVMVGRAHALMTMQVDGTMPQSLLNSKMKEWIAAYDTLIKKPLEQVGS